MIKNAAILLIKFYRNIFSNNMLHYCRFYPTCSQYAIESIEKMGFLRGLVFSVFRILRCSPFSKGGFDPVSPVRDLKRRRWPTLYSKMRQRFYL